MENSSDNTKNMNMGYYGPGTDDLTFIPLTRKEEAALFKRYYAADIEKRTKGWKDALAARDEIIQNFLRHVAKIAIQCAKRTMPMDEAISAGNFGLMEALKYRTFKPRLGRFGTYLTIFIRSRIFEELRNRGPAMIPLSPTGKPLIGEDESSALFTTNMEALTFRDAPYEDRQLNEFRREILGAAIRKLKGLQQTSLRLVGLEGHTHDYVARQAGVTRQASQAAFKRGVEKLRKTLKKHYNELQPKV
jgi:RNA polymerase sigma factor (sigma-70 family)